MAQPPILVMTRPTAEARRFVADCEKALGGRITVVFAPVMDIRPVAATVDAACYAGFILTSANGAQNAPELAGKPVYCVGEKTAAAARARGARIALVAKDADDLVARTIAAPPPAPLLHLRGEHARGQVAERLTRAGIRTEEAIVYAQAEVSLTAEAKAAIMGDEPVVLPIFSPRSAHLAGAAVDRPGKALHVIVISQAVAQAWAAETGGLAEVCDAPTGEEMLQRTIAALRG